MTRAPGDDPDRAAFDACARSALGSVPGFAVPVPGVVRASEAGRGGDAAASASTRPADVGFVLAGPPRVEGPWLVVRGELVNGADEPRRVFLVEAGAGVLHATLVGDGVIRRPAPPAEPGVTPPPHLFPEPQGFDLAPRVRWPFETRIALPCWDIAPGRPLCVHWWFAFAGESLEGELSVS